MSQENLVPDLARLPAQLCAWLSSALGEQVRIDDVEQRGANAFSNTTLLFDAERADDESACVERLVARVHPSGASTESWRHFAICLSRCRPSSRWHPIPESSEPSSS
jgi:hypothetical protein